MATDFFDYKDAKLYSTEERDVTFQDQIPHFSPDQVGDANIEAGSNLTKSVNLSLAASLDSLALDKDTHILTDILVASRHKEQARAASALEFSNPDDYTWKNSASVMLGQILADPYGMGVALTAAMAVSSLGSVAAVVAPTAAEVLTATIVRRIGMGAVEGVLSEVIEGEIEVAASREEARILGTEFTDADASNVRKSHIIFGGVLGGIAGALSSKYLRRVREAEADMTVMAAGKLPEIEYRSKANAHLDYEPEYKVSKVYDVHETPSPKYEVSVKRVARAAKDSDEVVGAATPDSKFYAVHHNVTNGKFNNNSQYSFGTSFGNKGTVFTTNKGFARGAASNPLNGDTGHIITLKGKNLNLLDISKSADPELRQAFNNLMVQNGVHPITARTLINSAKTNADLLHAADRAAQTFKDPQIQEYFNDILKEQGYDGIAFSHIYPKGVEKQLDEGVYIFDPSEFVGESIDEIKRAKGIGGIDPVVKQSVEDELNYLNSPESNIFHDVEASNKFNELEEIPFYDSKGEADSLLKQQDEILTGIENDLIHNPKAIENPSYYKELIKDIKNCLGVS